MSIEVIIGIGIILIVAIWAAIYIYNRNRENNNEHLFDFIPHLFPTLGILFTFFGIAIGLWNFDSNDIEKSIPELMNGLKTAFLVSIFGVFLLVVFSFWTNIKRKKLEEGVLSEETIAIQKLTEVLTELKKDFYYTDENGNVIKPGNVLRDIYEESKKQSNSLQTFSTDLALTISAGFEQILNHPSEGVVAELKLIKTEIENLGNKLKDPATDMTQSIVKELQEAIHKMIEELKNSISGGTKNEIERLADLLEKAGTALTDFPSNLQVMSEILKNVVAGFETGLKNVLIGQTATQQVSESLLNAFNTSIEKMKGLSSGVTETISKLNQAQSELERVIATFSNISQDVNASSSKFGESQVTFSKYSNEFLQNNLSTIQEIQKSLLTAREVSTDYTQKFEIIEKGLQEIFAKINTGLKDYQTTVGQSLETYLGKYTEHLTKTAESLAAASAKQEDILEELTEQLSRLNVIRN
jgi:hypothetical protein